MVVIFHYDPYLTLCTWQVNQTEPILPPECPEGQTPLECLGDIVGPLPECTEEQTSLECLGKIVEPEPQPQPQPQPEPEPNLNQSLNLNLNQSLEMGMKIVVMGGMVTQMVLKKKGTE